MYDIVFLLGALLGMVGLWFCASVLWKAMQVRFREYYLYQDDHTKAEIMGDLESILLKLEQLQRKTNEQVMKSKYNQFVELVALMQKRKRN